MGVSTSETEPAFDKHQCLGEGIETRQFSSGLPLLAAPRGSEYIRAPFAVGMNDDEGCFGGVRNAV